MKDRKFILCFGEILWDILPSGKQPGGAPMNVALHLSRFGMESQIASSVGKDRDGTELIDFLNNSELNASLIQINSHLPTSTVKVKLDKNKNATFEIADPVAWDEITLDKNLSEIAKKSRAIVYGSLAARNQITRNTLLKLLQNDLLKIMDVNLRPPYTDPKVVKTLMEKANIIKLNYDELDTVSEWYQLKGGIKECMYAIKKILQIDTIITTGGRDGACLIHKNEYLEQHGFKVTAVDTVGSGDAFLAGFISAFFENKSMNQALKEACAIGAFVATKVGATPEYSREVISAFINK